MISQEANHTMSWSSCSISISGAVLGDVEWPPAMQVLGFDRSLIVIRSCLGGGTLTSVHLMSLTSFGAFCCHKPQKHCQPPADP